MKDHDRGPFAYRYRAITPRQPSSGCALVEDSVALMNAEDATAVAAVGAQRAAIATAVQWVSDAFRRGGRLIYVGAGTSGRLGVLDASGMSAHLLHRSVHDRRLDRRG